MKRYQEVEEVVETPVSATELEEINPLVEELEVLEWEDALGADTELDPVFNAPVFGTSVIEAPVLEVESGLEGDVIGGDVLGGDVLGAPALQMVEPIFKTVDRKPLFLPTVNAAFSTGPSGLIHMRGYQQGCTMCAPIRAQQSVTMYSDDLDEINCDACWLVHSQTKGTGNEPVVMALADWHQSTPLSQYMDTQSAEWKRDSNKFGVYIIMELIENRYVPRFIEAIPVYVGMSARLSQRLRMHNMGRGSNPAEHVTAEYLATCSKAERKAYKDSSPEEQRLLRQLCVERRHMWVRTAHTRDLLTARQLEKTIIRVYESMGVQLWNKIKYTTTPPFPAI